MSKVIHSGTGRIGWLKMRPMSLWESGDSTGEVSLAELFTDPNQIRNRDIKIFGKQDRHNKNEETGFPYGTYRRR